jgi:DNA-binding winged helix-turn-helix (wHTH) protein
MGAEAFQLDTVNECVRLDGRELRLTPKAYAVLAYLVERSGRLVTKRELLSALWPGVIVGDAVLKVSVREIRKVLGDEKEAPRFIETLHRRGYRFVGGAQNQSQSGAAPPPSPVAPPSPSAAEQQLLVGRGGVLESLSAAFARTSLGRRQVVFLSGEAGIGKTAVTEAFVSSLTSRPELAVARGHCLEHFGEGEPYRPLLDALARLAQSEVREELVEMMRRTAPTWLDHMPALLSPAERAAVDRETLGATRERMLREMAELIEAIGAHRTLVLVIEDLHWSDDATLDLLSLVARRTDPVRLLLVATYRPEHVLAGDHALKNVVRDLRVARAAQELTLQQLGAEDVRELVERRFDGAEFSPRLADWLHQRTEGQPFFLANVLDDVIAKGRVVHEGGRWRLTVEPQGFEVPDTVRQMIEAKLDRLDSRARAALEAGALAGLEFAAAAVAAAVEEDEVALEALFEELALSGRFVRRAGLREWPDGTVSARYAFKHWLYQSLLYASVPPARAARLHARFGERGERAFGQRAPEVAAELAVHFERGRVPARAIHHLRAAARIDLRRCAVHEAAALLARALALAPSLAADERIAVECGLFEQRGLVRRAMGDMAGAAADFESLVGAARAAERLDLEVQGLLYLGTALFWVGRERCLPVFDLALEKSRGLEDTLLAAHARGWVGHWNLNLRGFRAGDVEACERAVAAARDAGDRAKLSLHLVRLAYAMDLCGRYERAVDCAREGRALAQEISDSFDYLLSHFFEAWALLHLGEHEALRTCLAEGIRMADRNGHRLWESLFRLELAQLHVASGEPAKACALAEPIVHTARQEPTGTGQILFHGLIVLGDALLAHGKLAAAAAALAEVVERTSGAGEVLDRLLELPLLDARSRCAAALGDRVAARSSAQDLLDLASRSGAADYVARAHATLASLEKPRKPARAQKKR